MKNIFFITVIVLSLFGSVLSGCSHSNDTKSEQKEEKVFYKCPMDCEPGKTYDKPGKCPVCEMELETKV